MLSVIVITMLWMQIITPMNKLLSKTLNGKNKKSKPWIKEILYILSPIGGQKIK